MTLENIFYYVYHEENRSRNNVVKKLLSSNYSFPIYFVVRKFMSVKCDISWKRRKNGLDIYFLCGNSPHTANGDCEGGACVSITESLQIRNAL